MIALAPASAARTSHLAFALLCLPKHRRRDALVFYRFCRAVDDIADEPGPSPAERQRLLDEWLASIPGNLPSELEDVVTRHSLDRSLLKEIVRGCAMDIQPTRYPTFASLEKYCWRVACAVGLVSIRIFGCRDPQSHEYAENLGYALQLTNILRDVSEDARRGRIYLPEEDLMRFGVDAEELLTGRPGAGFLPLMQFEACRARERFAAAIPPSKDVRALLPSEIMRAFYVKILDRLEATNFPVFRSRVSLGKLEKLMVAAAVAVRRLGIFRSQRQRMRQ